MGNWPLAPLPWQQPQWAQLQLALDRGAAPPALLLAGRAGIGKQQFGQALAARLLCHSPVAGTACGDCRSCVLLQAGNHGDLLWISPPEGKRVIPVDQIRAAIHFANQTPGLGERKVIALDPAESLNISGSNALLKSLEEPSANTHIILVSHAASGLPATIRSRCQRLNLAQPAAEEALAWVETLCGEAGLAQQLLEAGAGAPLHAARIYHADSLAAVQARSAMLEALLSGQLSPLEVPPLCADMELVEVLSLFEGRLIGEIRAKSGQNAAIKGMQRAFALLDEWQRLRTSVANGANPNRQMTIENCALRLLNTLGAVSA